MSTRHRRTSWFLLALGAVTLVLYWPLFSGSQTLNGAAADLLLPAFSHMRESLLQGTWPLWNKYQLQGIETSIFLIYWNPVYLLFSILFSSPSTALNALYLFLILLSGVGFYKFSGSILSDERSAFLGGLCYPLAGFFVVQGTRIEVVTAAAWIPVLLYSHRHYFRHGQMRDLTILLISFYLFATGTSPGLVFTGIALLFTQSILSRSYDKNQNIRRGLYSIGALIASGFLVWKIYLVRWLSYYPALEFSPDVESFQSIFYSFFSLALSKTTAVETGLWDFTGPVHIHMYTGIIVLVLAIFSMGYARTKTDRCLGWYGMIFLGLSILLPLIESVASGRFLNFV